MKLTGTARGENLLLLIEDAKVQAKTFYGPNMKFKIALTDATAEREAVTWGGTTTRTAFVAGFEASQDEDTK